MERGNRHPDRKSTPTMRAASASDSNVKPILPMARFSAPFCLRVFGAGVVLATAFSLQAPLSSRSTVAPAGKALAFAPPKGTGVPAPAGLVKKENDFSFRLQSVAGGAAAPAPKKNALLEKVWNENTKLVTYITVWYLGNIWYNIYNKKALNLLGKNGGGALGPGGGAALGRGSLCDSPVGPRRA
ncbi:hypothetical protein Naga_101190g1, partial [Nannochloropsis gaditana]